MVRCLVAIVSPLLFLICGTATLHAESPESLGDGVRSETAAKVEAVGQRKGKAGSKAQPKISRKKTLAYSQRIDELVEQKLEDADLRRNRPISDQAFARRAYLSVVGRIPNIDEVNRFLGSKASQKRSNTIDELLDSYGYVSHQFNFMADLLRLQTKMGNNTPGGPYIQYVKDALEKNTPYDELVYELLASEGAIFEEGNGAVGYYLRDRNMPEDNMSNSIRIFLGTRLECAQCHDHPFDKWTQRQYFEMVAFTGGMSYRLANENRNGNSYQQAKKLMERYKKEGREVDFEVFQKVRRGFQYAMSGISGSGTGMTRLPEDYEGLDGSGDDIVTAKTMFEGEVIVDVTLPKFNPKKNQKKRKYKGIPNAKEIGSRAVFAKWMTEEDNPRFAKVIANRLWKKAFGLGLIEPVDVIEDSTIASNPELMDYLTELMIEVDFDMKEFLRIIYNTKTWQAEVTKTDIASAQKYAFPGPVMRRMSAEQLWDSMIGLTVDEVDRRHSGEIRRGYLTGGMSPQEVYQQLKDGSLEDLVEQALSSGRGKKGDMMMSGDAEKRKLKFDITKRKLKAELKQKLKDLSKEIKLAQKQGNTKLMRELMVRRTEIVAKSRVDSPNSQYRRASEMTSPAPPKHLLREFGQSDRETIDNANTEPAVTQVLRLMNGFVDQQIANDVNSVLTRNALYANNAYDAIDQIYLTMLTRRASAAEKRVWAADFSRDKKTAFADLVWTLINSNEFVFVR